MPYAKIVNGQVVEYPAALSNLPHEHPEVSFPRTISDQLAEDYGYVVVHPRDPDLAIDDTEEEIIEDDPVLISGAWRQGWSKRMLPIAQRKQRKKAKKHAEGFQWNGKVIPVTHEDMSIVMHMDFAFRQGENNLTVVFSNQEKLTLPSSQKDAFFAGYIAAQQAILAEE